MKELEAVGAHDTILGLKKLDDLRKKVDDLEESEERIAIESEIPGDFDWADPVLEFVRNNPDRFLKH